MSKYNLIFTVILYFGIIKFTSAQSPQISSLSSNYGELNSTITINGNNFDNSTLNNVVYFGGVKGKVINASSNQLSVNIPSGLSYHPISVINTNTGLQSYSKPFTTTFNDDNIRNFTDKSFYTETMQVSNMAFYNYLQLADIDGDSKLDLVVAKTFDQTISIYRNSSPTGKFSSSYLQLAANYSVTPSYLSYGIKDLKFADIDSDGKLDMIVLYRNQNKIGVYRNNSTPGVINNSSFQDKVEFNVGLEPISLTIADLNHDGKPEIITANNSINISILLNNSSKGSISSNSLGQFQNYSLGGISSCFSIATADIDDDKKLDLVIGTNDGVDILRNTTENNHTLFSFIKKNIHQSVNKQIVAVGDLNKDGKIDIVTAYAFNKKIATLKNTSTIGNINYEQANTYNTSNELYNAIIIDDINSDTKPDIILGGGNIFQNNSLPDSSITLSKEVSASNEYYLATLSDSFVTGDMDNDGKIDIIADHGRSALWLIKNNIVGIPIFSSFSPNKAKEGDTVTISGKYLERVTAVSFGGVGAKNFTIKSSTEMVAIVNDGASGDISLSSIDGIASKEKFTFVPPLPPSILSFAPKIASIDETVTINGNNFDKVINIYFGDVAAKSFRIISSNRIDAVVGNGASGKIVLKTKYDIAEIDSFKFVLRPKISSFSPISAKKDEEIKITGVNLTDVTAVTLGGYPVKSFRVISSTEIIATVGYGESGTVNVISPYGSSNLLTTFTYISGKPIINNFYPLKAKSGDLITIKGDNFHTNSALNFVYFGITRGKVISSTPTEIIVQVPFGATYHPITVYAHDKTAFSKLPFTLTYANGNIKNSFGKIYEYPEGTIKIFDINFDGLPDIFRAPSNGRSSYPVTFIQNQDKEGFKEFDLSQTYIDEPCRMEDIAFYPKGDVTEIKVVVSSSYKEYFFLKNDFNINHPYLSSLKYIGEYAGSRPLSELNFNDFNNDGLLEDFSSLRYENITISDFNSDGKPDLLVRDTSKNTIAIYNNLTQEASKNTNYVLVAKIVLNGKPMHISTGDFNDDEKIDISVSVSQLKNSGSIVFFKNNSLGDSIMFSKELEVNNINNPSLSTAGDLNGDGKIDILLSSGNNETYMFVNNSTKDKILFNDYIKLNIGSSKSLMICDMNKDGRPDIVASVTNKMCVFKNLLSDPHIASFSPKIARKGSVITIKGFNLSNVTAVNFGGIAAESFNILSDTVITAIVKDANTNHIEVITDYGKGSLSDFNFVKQLSLNYRSNVTQTGQYVYISTNYISGVFYQWYHNDKLIPDRQISSVFATESGSYFVTAKIDNQVFNSDTVNVCVGCILPSNNFSIAVKDVSCVGLKDGSIKIKSKLNYYNYFVEVNSPNRLTGKFKDSINFSGLPPGTYGIIVRLSDAPSVYQTFTVVIAEPKDLNIYTAVNHENNSLTLKLDGADTYLIEFNGNSFPVNTSSLVLNLKNGANQLIVHSNKICQGEYHETIYYGKPLIFPLPFISDINIILPEKSNLYHNILINDNNGKVVFNKSIKANDGNILLDLNTIKSGIYFLTIDNTKYFHKIVKK